MVRGFPELQHAAVPDWQLETWDRTRPAARNLGGVVRTGYVVIECDSLDAERQIVDLDPRLETEGPARERRAGRGRAFVLRLPWAADLRPATKCGPTHAVDILPAGSLLILPPSVHASGEQLRWVECRNPWRAGALAGHEPSPALWSCILEWAARRSDNRPATPTITPGYMCPRAKAVIRGGHGKRLWDGRGGKQRDQSESGYDYMLAIALLREGVSTPNAVATLAERPRAKRREVGYFARTVDCAARWLVDRGEISRWAV